MSTKKVTTVLIGASGYGSKYVKELLFTFKDDVHLVGIVDIAAEESDYYKELLKRKIPIYTTLRDFYRQHDAQLAIVSTPIHLHKEHSCIAMRKGSHVLCEKPVAISFDHMEEMKKVSEEMNKFLAVGFNWSFTEPVQALKKDILANRFGKPKRFKSITLWPRTEDYYTRSQWAGRKKGPHGEWIYDSIASNAAAHYLHHLLFLAGCTKEKSATIKKVEAELYKINDIETFDTCAVRLQTKEGIELYYYASHAVKEVYNPRYELIFEEATIYYNQDEAEDGIVVQWHNGEITTYEDPSMKPFDKINVCIQAIQEGHQRILCNVDTATPHVEAIHAIHDAVPSPMEFPKEIRRYDKALKLRYVHGLEETLLACYEDWKLPYDLGVQWSKGGYVRL